jgi:hypothetical protein
MTKAKGLNIFGLALVIAGCFLLYFFGLPPAVNPRGTSAIIMEQVDEAEIARGKLYVCLGRVGIALVGVGSGFQICGVYIG